MEKEDIYTKTSRGSAETAEKRHCLPREAYGLLSQIDGRTPLDLLQLRMEPIPSSYFLEMLDLLLEHHLVELIEVYTGTSVLGPISDSGVTVDLLDSDIGAQAWANAVIDHDK